MSPAEWRDLVQGQMELLRSCSESQRACRAALKDMRDARDRAARYLQGAWGTAGHPALEQERSPR